MKLLKRRARLFAPRSPILVPWFNYLRLRPFPFATWVRTRMWAFSIWGKVRRRDPWQVRTYSAHDSDHVFEKVIPHNFPLHTMINRARTERLINILRSVGVSRPDKSNVLCIGPRNEAEVFLLSLYGFPLKNIKAIDLFSYSPLIQVMDMHRLEFDDDAFDIVYSSFVLRYSHDIERAVAETLRVTKNGGLVAVGFVYGADSEFVGTKFENGLLDLFEYFGNHVDQVFWREEWQQSNDEIVATTVFSVRK